MREWEREKREIRRELITANERDSDRDWAGKEIEREERLRKKFELKSRLKAREKISVHERIKITNKKSIFVFR